MKVLIYHSYGMGDMVMFTPVLELLNKYNSNIIVDFIITNNEKASIKPIENYKNLGQIYFIKLTKLRIDYILKGIKIRKNKYDLLIMTNGSTRLPAEIFSLLVRPKIIAGEIREERKSILRYLKNYKLFNRYQKCIMENFSEKRHRVEANLSLIEKILDINLKSKKYINTKYYLNKRNLEYAENFYFINKLEKYQVLGIHPGCNKLSSEKRWPKERYLEILNKLKKKIKIIIFIGPDEIEIGEYLQNNIQSENIFFCKDKDLSNIAAVISKCSYFFNNDSGLGHIAGSFSLKIVVTIIGPALATMTKVWGKNCHVIQITGKNIEYYRKKNENGILRCLDDIKVEDVYIKLEKILNERE